MTETPASIATALLQPWRQAALLVGVTLAVFSPTLSSGFVYDARLQILTDPFLHEPRNWWHVLAFRTLGMDVLDFNRPVNLASLMFDAAVWGRDPFGYHLTSVLLHTANVVMLWGVVRQVSRASPEDPDAAQARLFSNVIAPLLFAVHPVVTEAVCEPTFREDLLVAFFTLGGLLLAMGHRAGVHGFDAWRVLGCVACSVLAIGSKESGIAAPVVIGVYRLCWRRGERGWFWPVTTGGATLVVCGFLAARFLLEPIPSKIFEVRPQYPGGSLAAALLIEPRIVALYAQLILLPVNLCADYGLYSVAHVPLPAALVVLAALVVAAALAVRADGRMALAIALVVVPLAPVANVIPIYRAAADRYLYLPMAGLGLVARLVFDAPWLVGRAWLRDRLLLGAALAATMLGLGCMERQKVWANPLALWTDTFRKNPAASTAASGLAEALREVGRLKEAESAARRSIELSEGKRGDTWATLALVLEGQGRTAEAFKALDKALGVQPQLADPDGRVSVMAMERQFADDLKKLLTLRNDGS